MSDDTPNTDGLSDSGGSVTADTGDPGASSAPAESPTIDSIFDEVTASLGEGAAPSDAASGDPSEPATPPASATVTPPAETTPEAPPPSSPGEPPKERWPDILENARSKTREEVLQHVVQQYGSSLQVVEALKSDPVGTVVQLMSELQADPRFAAQMASHAARTLRSARSQTEAVAGEEPQPDLDAGNGVLLYSAQQQAKREAWLQARWQAQMQQVLQPVQQDLQARRAAEQAAAERQQVLDRSAQRLKAWDAKPAFQQHKDTIRQKQAEYYKAGYDPWDALALAYSDVLETTVVPAAHQKTQSDLVASAAQKLRAATPNPATTAPAASRKARDLDDAFDLALGELSR